MYKLNNFFLILIYLFSFNFFYNFEHIFYSCFYTTKQEENNTNFLIFYFFLIIQFEKKRIYIFCIPFPSLFFSSYTFFPINQTYSSLYNNNNFKPLHLHRFNVTEAWNWCSMRRLKPDAVTVHMHRKFFSMQTREENRALYWIEKS